MSTAVARARSYRFDQFELLPAQGALLSGGQRVPLTPKPFATLVMLVERAGETVLKDELLAEVWEGAAVEENNLTQCISTLRKVLGEKRGENRYILTDPGKGYRFVAAVTEIDRMPAALESKPPSEPNMQREGRWRRSTAVIAAGVVLFLALGGWLYSRAAGLKPVRHSVAVLRIHDLSKASSEAWIQTALPEMLISELSAADRLRTVPADDVFHWQRDVGASLENAGQSAVLRSARDTFGADAFVLGSYVVTGSCPGCRVRVDLGLYDARTGDRLATVIDEGPGGDLLDLTARLGAGLRAKLGVDAASTATPRWPATDAMREYTEGIQALRLLDPMAARDHLQNAVAADGSNALIHASLADAWTALGYQTRANQEYQRAYELSKPLGRLDQLGIEGRYRMSLQQWDRAIEIYKNVWSLFPDSLEDGLNLARAQMRATQFANVTATLKTLRSLPGPAGRDPRIDLIEAQNAGARADFSKTRDYAHRAADEASAIGARYLYARARLLESGATLNLGDAKGGLALLAEARDRCQEIGDRSCVARTWRVRGNSQVFATDFSAAQESYMTGLAIARDLGDTNEMGIILTGLGVVARSRRDWQQAENTLSEAISLRTETGYSPSDVETNLADLYIEMGRPTDALKSLDRAEKAAAGDQQDLGEVLRMRAMIAQSAGELEQAQRFAENAVSELRPTNGAEPLALALAELASVLTARGDLARAQSLLAEAVVIPSPEVAGNIELARAELLLAQDKLDEANEAAKKSIAGFVAANHDPSAARALTLQADALELLGKRGEALAASHDAVERAARAPNRLASAFARLAQWRLAENAGAVMPAELQAAVAPLRNPELDLAALYARARRAKYAGLPNARRLFEELTSAASNRGYVTLSRRAQAFSLGR